ncbi:hypothetical protein K7432_005308 [Basidiobolus ranarum]|uniref:Uncharacterized protein n=1 Tax=Basidiobolus ranarum TaxID=34480 RepID=A0ABR2WWP9_9FUNG
MFTVIPCFSKVGIDFEEEIRPTSNYRKAYRFITLSEPQSPPVLPDIPLTSPIKLDLIIPPLEEIRYEDRVRNVPLRRRSSMRKKVERVKQMENQLSVPSVHRRSESNPEGMTKSTRAWNSWCASDSRELFFLEEDKTATFYSHKENFGCNSPTSAISGKFMAFEELLTKREDCGDEITIKISLTPSLLK